MRRRPVSVRCHAKVNLGLRVLGVRPDGYHEVRTILHTVDLHDTLDVEPSSTMHLDVDAAGLAAPGGEVPTGDGNLVLKAARCLEDLLEGKGAAFRLRKRIPSAAGMGGASSDAAGALLALDRLYNLGIPPLEMHRRAATLGADVPFFLYGGAGLGLGRGEEVYPLPDGPPLHLCLAFPGEGLETPVVYRAWDDMLTSDGKTSRMSDFAPWCLVLRGECPSVANDLEEAALRLCPSLKRLRATLETTNALAASMTGSGSAFFGIYSGARAAAEAAGKVAKAGYAALAARSIGREERERLLFRDGASGRARGPQGEL